MLFSCLFILFACCDRPPALAAFILEQIQRRHLAVGPQHLQRTFLGVLRWLRDAIQIHRDRPCTRQTARAGYNEISKK